MCEREKERAVQRGVQRGGPNSILRFTANGVSGLLLMELKLSYHIMDIYLLKK